MDKEELLQELKDLLDSIDIQYGLCISYEVKCSDEGKYLQHILIS